MKNAPFSMIAAAALNGVACGNTYSLQTETPHGTVSSYNAPRPAHSADGSMAVPRLNEPVLPFDIQVVPMNIAVKPPAKPWPNVPADCAYTGVVLNHDQTSVPHSILLENACYQEREGIKNVFAGRHLRIPADQTGRYRIPFIGAHLEEIGGNLVFVTGPKSHRIEEPLAAGIESETQTFAPSLDRYGIEPIIGQ